MKFGGEGVRILWVTKTKYHVNLKYNEEKLRNKTYITMKQTADEIRVKK
jgi:hypothetical protein